MLMIATHALNAQPNSDLNVRRALQQSAHSANLCMLCRKQSKLMDKSPPLVFLKKTAPLNPAITCSIRCAWNAQKTVTNAGPIKIVWSVLITTDCRRKMELVYVLRSSAQTGTSTMSLLLQKTRVVTSLVLFLSALYVRSRKMPKLLNNNNIVSNAKKISFLRLKMERVQHALKKLRMKMVILTVA